MKSSTVLKYVGQYGFLAGAIAWIGGSAFDFVKGVMSGGWNTDEIVARAAVGSIHLVAFLYFRNKFVVVELGGQNVKIFKDNDTIETTWQHIESVERVIFSSPPMYTIRIKGVKGYFIFWNSAMNLLWFDHSELGELICQKKRGLGI